ncbi:hypothetical protein BGW36DRAFT_424966 [Talaromyces proteolyticus]|uniref:Major facilitator superfamily (MFS) profile domain-containing protein n=1 Tax=Talaromyces proteolyticus TaxID=1131652 RepID=A0AAD4PZT6_9EURO|nr:uncharacterized protein BGW36DRAFT_424966 [Talaromyces proteolyticus]KAH8700129.1 hypothetical protein BGW36DRAFT_424966 [Talaromyces proteolyticus]
MHDDSKAEIQDEEHHSIKDGAFQSEEDTGHKPISIREYVVSRLTSLKPPTNSFLAVSFLACSWGAFDYFTVSLTVSDLAETFGTSTSDITRGITVVLMFRSVSSITNLPADAAIRPFIINLVLSIVLEPGTSFCQTYQQFLAVRAPYGVAMGGMYGIAAVTALEDCPKEARGLVAGLMQQGYAFGYLLATAFARALVNTTSHGWRANISHKYGLRHVFQFSLLFSVCAWSVIPICVLELSPVAFQAFVVGSAYQFGNLASSASSTIEATIGERFPLPPLTKADGTVVDRYYSGKVICILTGAAYAYIILLLLLGPEKKGRSTDGVADTDSAGV